MKNLIFLVSVLMSTSLMAQVLPADVQIKTAVLAAPEEKRENVTVYGYDEQGKMITLREGKENLICLADNPNKEGINVACYSKKLEPFMARGRELIAEGKTEMEKRQIREKEAASGALQMPDAPSMLYILSGNEEDYDATTGDLQNAKFRYVIYTPWATTESTGLPDKPHVPGMPWLMDPGTHRAHIMVTPEN